MGKHEVGTPKYIANKIKSKGLQKLRWYCQMCEKQCRDENGFKCHTQTESHHRKLLLFADNQHKYMDEFSREFSDGFINLLKRQFGTRRTPANRIYQEYIADRGHVHMNATIWLSLTAFIKWLGRTGKCVVDETEKGWFVTYIDRDPETLAFQEKQTKKRKMDKDDDERMRDFIQKQVESGRQEIVDLNDDSKAPLTRPEDDAPIVIDLQLKPKPASILSKGVKSRTSTLTIPTDSISNTEGDDKHRSTPSSFNSEDSTNGVKNVNSRRSDDDNSVISKRNEKRKTESNEQVDTPKNVGWLRRGLIVKIITKSLGEKYYKAKGEVLSTVLDNGFVGNIKIRSPDNVKGHVIKLDQEHLETVIPKIGNDVLVLRGEYAGSLAVIDKVTTSEFSVDVELVSGSRIVKGLPYEAVCKYVEIR